MNSSKIMIIGTLPPPIGGVTVHLQRFLTVLGRRMENGVLFFDYRRDSIFSFLSFFFCARLIHLHLSNSFFRILLVVFCRLAQKKIILTFHGKIGARRKFGNICDALSIRFCTIPIVLNESSFEIAVKLNKQSVLAPAFIPPQEEEVLQEKLCSLLTNIRNKHEKLFSTNAFNLVYDTDGREVYGISELVRLFKDFPRHCLIVSDPTKKNYDMMQREKKIIPENVVFVTYSHSYFELLKYVDFMIRNTTKDGDALSVKEALFLGKRVFATDVVSRHPCVKIYHDIAQLRDIISNEGWGQNECFVENLSGEELLLKVYQTT